MCLLDDFNGPEFQVDVVQLKNRNTRHKRAKVENPPEWYAIFGIKEVTELDAMDIWI